MHQALKLGKVGQKVSHRRKVIERSRSGDRFKAMVCHVLAKRKKKKQGRDDQISLTAPRCKTRQQSAQ